MAQQPAVIIIARHGSRYDSVNQQWLDITPAPYDPPLTYGGWKQSQELGERIAKLLHKRKKELEAQDAADMPTTRDGPKRPQRRHKVVIHSSPFLRCLQTSVGVAAGMARYAPPVETSDVESTGTPVSESPIERRRSLLRTSARSGDATSAIPSQNGGICGAQSAIDATQISGKPEIRVDAFLGEWLNPQYFEQITPPPPSTMMLAAAKGELLQNEPIDVYVPSTTSRASAGKLWGGGRSGRANAIDDWAHVREQQPVRTRDRASSQSSVASIGSPTSRKSPFRPGGILQPLTSSVPNNSSRVYSPPFPHYAISPSDHIPKGYVAHARDSCANVDYEWDSSRPSLNWGDGGTLGESWSEMHKRLRRGINSLVEYYGQQYSNGDDKKATDDNSAKQTCDNAHEDLVVILVTHNATGNALIGALSGQPALVDLGVASLTWADRREVFDPSIHQQTQTADDESISRKSSYSERSTHPRSRQGSLDRGLSTIYELKLIASSDHLRPQINTSRTWDRDLSGGGQAVRDSLFKHRQHYGSDSFAPYSDPFSPSSPVRYGKTSPSPGSIRNPSITDSTGLDTKPLDTTDPPPAIHTGLWKPPTLSKPILQAREPDGAEERNSCWLSTASKITEKPTAERESGMNDGSSPVDSLSKVAERIKHVTVSAAIDHKSPDSDGDQKLLPPIALDGTRDEYDANSEDDFVAELPSFGNAIIVSPHGRLDGNDLESPQSSPTTGSRARDSPKRRWTITHNH